MFISSPPFKNTFIPEKGIAPAVEAVPFFMVQNTQRLPVRRLFFFSIADKPPAFAEKSGLSD